MKRIFSAFLIMITMVGSASAYQLLSSKELGQNDAKNQNVVVKCTTPTGQVSTRTCSLRRYAKCTTVSGKKRCNGWQPWRDLKNPGKNYSDWKTAASACCRAMGLR